MPDMNIGKDTKIVTQLGVLIAVMGFLIYITWQTALVFGGMKTAIDNTNKTAQANTEAIRSLTKVVERLERECE